MMNPWPIITESLERNIKDLLFPKNSRFGCTFQEALQIFQEILYLQNTPITGLGDMLTKAVYQVCDNTVEQKRQGLVVAAVKLEAFLRKVLFLVDKATYDNFPEEKGAMAYYKALQLPIHDKFNDFHLYIKGAYDLRNKEAHTAKKWTDKQLAQDIEYVILTYLYAVAKHYKKLQTYIAISKEPDWTNYLKKIQRQYKEWQQKYVAIDGREYDPTLGLAEEVDMDFDDTIIKRKRKGTIDDLRKKEVSEKRMFIWGKAGTGKTTTFRYLSFLDAKACLEDRLKPLPVYVELRFADRDTKIKTVIAEQLGVSLELLEDLLTRGRLTLFFDGLNEIEDKRRVRQKIQQQIEQLIDQYPATFLLLSSRPASRNVYRNQKVPIFQLQPLSDAQIETFLEKNVPNKKIQTTIQNALTEDKEKRLHKVLQTPLLLARLIEVVHKTNEFPRSSGQIINFFLKGLLRREEQRDVQFNAEKATELLTALAVMMIDDKGTNAALTQKEVRETCVETIEDYKLVNLDWQYFIKKALNLNILHKQKRKYVFAHQEYLSYFNSLY